MQQALKHTQDIPSNGDSPLDELARLLITPMAAVNDTIIARSKTHIPLIGELAEYLIASGGKRIRPLLTLASAQAATNSGGDVSGAVSLAAAVEFIHSATLLHDDVVDESAQRRGKPAANLVYGNKATVLVGDFLFARAFELMVESDDIRILDILSRASRIISEGEVLQMSLTGDMTITLEQYEAVIDAKTAALFAAACESGALSAKADKETATALRLYGHHLGMAFQMIDDLMDYAERDSAMGKDAGDDFREGKLTLPVILALADATDEERAFWTRTMKDHKHGDGDLAADLSMARQYLARHTVMERGRAMAANRAKAAREALGTLPETPMRRVLDELLDFVVTRDH